ncbi:class II fumarate hydratase [soil metagenome]
MVSRIETDSMGDVEVAEGRYWGAQTQRSLQNFKIGGQRFGRPVIAAFGTVKMAASVVNRDLGKLDPKLAALIAEAAGKVEAGDFDEHFPLVVWQTGSGTQSNMNANEVIANVANEIGGAPLGGAKKGPIHPNDHVNMSQSSNDVFPTVMHVAAALHLTHRLLPAVTMLRLAITEKSEAFADLVKIGRTHLMDATPLTLGQEMSAWAAQLAFAEKKLEASKDDLLDLALGGTAVGTGMNTHPEWATRVAAKIAELTGLPFRSAPNKFAALAGHEAIVAASGATRVLATACMKIANDVRLLASGPRCGLGELSLPANEPGSSIMPGKVNPTQAEALTMVAAHVMGNDVGIGIAGASGHLQLNGFKPMLIHDLLESIDLLADACDSFRERCVVGIEANRETIARHVGNSLMLVTALAPLIGYDRSAKIAKSALETNVSLREAALASGLVTAEQFDAHVRPAEMLRP